MTLPAIVPGADVPGRILCVQFNPSVEDATTGVPVPEVYPATQYTPLPYANLEYIFPDPPGKDAPIVQFVPLFEDVAVTCCPP